MKVIEGVRMAGSIYVALVHRIQDVLVRCGGFSLSAASANLNSIFDANVKHPSPSICPVLAVSTRKTILIVPSRLEYA